MIGRNGQKTEPELTGLSSPPEDHGPDVPLSLAWINEDLVEETQRVWSKAYGRVVTRNEAVEMLVNVKHVVSVFMSAEK